MAMVVLLGALINLTKPGMYLHWGDLQISAANFVVIVVMIVLFLLAIFVPFQKRSKRS